MIPHWDKYNMAPGPNDRIRGRPCPRRNVSAATDTQPHGPDLTGSRFSGGPDLKMRRLDLQQRFAIRDTLMAQLS